MLNVTWVSSIANHGDIHFVMNSIRTISYGVVSNTGQYFNNFYT